MQALATRTPEDWELGESSYGMSTKIINHVTAQSQKPRVSPTRSEKLPPRHSNFYVLLFFPPLKSVDGTLAAPSTRWVSHGLIREVAHRMAKKEVHTGLLMPKYLASAIRRCEKNKTGPSVGT